MINIKYKKYRGKDKDGQFALLIGGEIVKIYRWEDPDENDRQKVFFSDKYGQTWWDYADRFLKFGFSKFKLKMYNRKRLKNI